MLKQVKIISELADYPFLLFQERICIYTAHFDNYELIQQFSEYYWEKIEEQIVSFHPVDTYTFAAVKFRVNDQTFLFAVIFDSATITTWTEANFTYFLNKTQAIVTILSDNSSMALKHSPSELPTTELKVTTNKPYEHGITDEEIDFSDNYQFEKIFIHQLRKGNIETLSKMLNQLSAINLTRLSEDKVTELKYRVVALITLVTRASIEYGCPPSLAYRLSDQLIRHLDTLQSLKEFPDYSKQMITEFSLLIEAESIPSTSLVVKKATQFIHQNLYDLLSLEIIAEEVAVHPAYLSTIFKKTLSQSLSQYIQHARVTEAKYLLTQTDFSYSQISELLHFSSQSYFGSIFKKITGYTPKEYRITH